MLALVRHALTDWSGSRYCGGTDLGLNEAGRAQLAPLAAYLASAIGQRPEILASPALRCRETADAIATQLGAEVRTDERLREVDFGEAEGATFDDLERRWPDLAAGVLRDDADIDWPGGERGALFIARVRSVWDELRARSGDTVVVTHGGPLRAMLGLAGRPRRLRPAEVALLPS